MRESNAELASFTCWKLVERCDRDDKIRPRAAHDVAECLLKQPYHLHEHGAPIEKPAERKRCEQGVAWRKPRCVPSTARGPRVVLGECLRARKETMATKGKSAKQCRVGSEAEDVSGVREQQPAQVRGRSVWSPSGVVHTSPGCRACLRFQIEILLALCFRDNLQSLAKANQPHADERARGGQAGGEEQQHSLEDGALPLLLRDSIKKRVCDGCVPQHHHRKREASG